MPEFFATSGQSLEQLTVPVLLLLTKLATYTIQLRNEKLHLITGVLFNDITTWYEKHVKKDSKNRPKAIVPDSKNKATPTQDPKIPFFKVSTFQGDTLQGDVFVEGVGRAFRSAAMARYLESRTYCDNNPCWLRAFASRIQESIATNDILSFLATELEHENNCSKVWAKVIKHLTTSDVTTAHVMSHWKSLFGLKCESRDNLLAFYSKTKGILHRLKKNDSAAVTYDVLLKAYFLMVIEAPELQTEVRGFLKDTTKTYMETLEVIHADYRAQTTGKDIRGVSGVPTTTSTLSCRTTVDVAKSKRELDVKRRGLRHPSQTTLGT